ncbi:hypothetical protein NIES4071_29940 [Calothrix sp. NIES-4071]|nr:hypothetical protein NIES4071_29940 [Calothrix sp. NIES-4071]BAZ57314.1 hypothetical protein NIES4105_29880 [Calothrix sp. NIES-4105]
MDNHLIPISTLFIGLNGIIAFILSYIVATERTKARIWHGESKEDISKQPDALANANAWAAFVENMTQKFLSSPTIDDGALQRKVRAHANFTEYVPLALLFIIALELMHSNTWLLWLLGVSLTVARIAHAWGLINTYGPSPGRAIGFFLTWFVYIVGSLACIYYSFTIF